MFLSLLTEILNINKRTFGTVVILAVSNRFSDLEHLKDKILEAVHSVSKGNIEHVS